MDTALLVENLIDDGLRLLVELVRDGFDVSAAAWVKLTDNRSSRLFVGSTIVDTGTVGSASVQVYTCLQKIPKASFSFSEVNLFSTSNPITRDIIAIRDVLPEGRIPTRYAGPRLGDLSIESAYIYPRITSGLTREEVIQSITALLSRPGIVHSSNVTLRNGTIIRGLPYGLELNRSGGQSAVLEIKIRDGANGTTRVVPADEVVNIQ